MTSRRRCWARPAWSPGREGDLWHGMLLPPCTGPSPWLPATAFVTTVAWDLGDGLEYALEGSVFIGGAVVQWLRDELRILSSSAESETMCASVPDTAAASTFVPAFVGLGAPYWDPDAARRRPGHHRGTRQEHIVRAALESIAPTRPGTSLMRWRRTPASRSTSVRVDGGASVNGFLMQFQADILGAPLVRPRSSETTALGAAFAAGLSAGVWKSREELSAIWQPDIIFEPADGRAHARLAHGGMESRRLRRHGCSGEEYKGHSGSRWILPPRGIEPLTHGFSEAH